jgi:GDP/UDP-N,N'-diacetylbacillosamine 2-epimerase (hydrolysing)
MGRRPTFSGREICLFGKIGGFVSTRRVCFVTGTRAEYGLMRTTLAAVRRQRGLTLQILATGTHLSHPHGYTVDAIRGDGFAVDAAVDWNSAGEPRDLPVQTAAASGGIAAELNRLDPDVVLVVGDRVEAFGGAVAGHLGGRIVAHVHGGDRALGQVDDCLRHAITKLSHVHFPATRQSRERLMRMGEDPWRVFLTGSPGLDGIREAARPVKPARVRRSAVLVLHPTGTDNAEEFERTQTVHSAAMKIGFDGIAVIASNNDPGSAGIARYWENAAPGVAVYANVGRAQFLGMIRDAAVLIGNSSSGIIEAASFGTPVVDIGDRQSGRERSGNVVHVPFVQRAIAMALEAIWNDGRPMRWRGSNVYGGSGAGRKIAERLASLVIDDRLRRKVIAY